MYVQEINGEEHGRDRNPDRYFKMGAAVAVGELYDSGKLGERTRVAGEVRSYLESFGLKSIEDVHDLGITGPYLHDFELIYSVEKIA